MLETIEKIEQQQQQQQLTTAWSLSNIACSTFSFASLAILIVLSSLVAYSVNCDSNVFYVISYNNLHDFL